MKDKISQSQPLLHRSWIRFLPYTALGAFLISVKSAANLSSLMTIYLSLMGVQLGAIAIYFLLNRTKER